MQLIWAVDFFMPEHSDPSSGIRPLLLIDQRTELPTAEWQAANKIEPAKAADPGGAPDRPVRAKLPVDKESDPAPSPPSDPGRNPSDWDKAKEAFARIFEDADASVRVLEQEKARILGLTQALTQIRESFEALQVRFNHAERRLTAVEHNNARLNYKMDSASDALREFKNSEPALLKENVALRTTLAEVERRLSDHAERISELSSDNHTLRERLIENERGAGLLVGEIALVREHLALLDNGSRSIRELLDHVSADVSRLSARAPDSDAPPARLRPPASSPALAPAPPIPQAKPDPERGKLIAELDESLSLHQTELGRLQFQVDSLAARVAGAEVATSPQRRFAIGRGDMPKPPEKVAIGELPARIAAEQKLAELKTVIDSYQTLVQTLEQSRAALSGRAPETEIAASTAEPKLDAKPLDVKPEAKSHEPAEPARPPAERIIPADTDPSDMRMIYEKRAEELRAALMHERLERKFAEGALHASRAERAQLQRELAKFRATTGRASGQHDAPAEPPRLREPEAPNRGSNAA
jgi:chromosome segregation ATPase